MLHMTQSGLNILSDFLDMFSILFLHFLLFRFTESLHASNYLGTGHPN